MVISFCQSPTRLRTLVALIALIAGVNGTVATSSAAAAKLPPIRHVFVIVLENKEFLEWYAPGPVADPYLSGTLESEGALAPNYFGVGHSSADNYIAMVSGQPPTTDSKNDCADPMRTVPTASDANGVARGNGCLYPPNFKDIGDQISAVGARLAARKKHRGAAALRWKAYAQNMPYPCYPGHDAPGNYVRKHNGFIFFESGVQDGDCAANDVPLTELPSALSSASTTANVNYIFPDQCDDGHSDCTGANPVPGVGSEADEMAQYDAFLRKYVPMITSAPAFKNGLLMIMFDEGDDPFGCCGEPATDPDGSSPGDGPGSPNSGGGQVGAVLISPFIAPGTVSENQYNHYSLLASIEDLFRLPRLAEARLPATTTFGSDIYTKPAG